MQEKRGEKRAAFVCEAICEDLASGTRVPNARISDLSCSGAFIDSLVVFSAGAQVRLSFALDGDAIEVTAEVVNPMPTMGMGVRFLDLTPAGRQAIERVVSND